MQVRPSQPLAHIPSRTYQRRDPEATVLHRVVRENLEGFLTRARSRERVVPRFVERAFRTFLRCGILAHGFVRVHCDACGHDRLVGFSCKGRGVCPSCGGRRMAELAAHMVDRVFPEVPVRQWVLTLPFALRYRLAYDARLAAAVDRAFVAAVFASLARRARGLGRGRRPSGSARRLRGGAVTFVQRSGDALNLNIHFHTLVLDGVYERYGQAGMRFRALRPPSSEELQRLLADVVGRIRRLPTRRGLGPEADPSLADPLQETQPLLAELAAASVQGRAASGPRAGLRPRRLGDQIDPEDLSGSIQGLAACDSFTLHAAVAVPGRDRRRLERLVRYAARPPLASDRLAALPDGTLSYRLKNRWRDGTTHILFEPVELLERLAALVPAPRTRLVKYHGVLAPCAGWRDRVVLDPLGGVRSVLLGEATARQGGDSLGPAAAMHAGVESSTSMTRCAGPGASLEEPPLAAAAGEAQGPRSATASRDEGAPVKKSRRKNWSWSEMMRRVFDLDVLECAACGGKLRVLAAIQDPDAIRAILDCLGLSSRPPPPPSPTLSDLF